MEVSYLLRDMQRLSAASDSDLFHRVVSEMVHILNFQFVLSWYEVDVKWKHSSVIFTDLKDLYFSKDCSKIKNIARRDMFVHYDNPSLDYIVSTTHHSDLPHLLSNDYFWSNLISGSDFGMTSKVLHIIDTFTIFKQEANSFEVALEKGYLVYIPNKYFFYPPILYDLCSNKIEK